MKKKNGTKGFLSKVPAWIWGVLSFLLALLVWWLISQSKHGGKVFASPLKVINALISSAESGSLWKHFIASFRRIILGFLQFLKNIPPISYIPLIVVAAGVGEESKVAVIFIACFLTMTITIFQGVKNVDMTLIKAARVLGANDFVIFTKVVVPASFPFIMTAMRLGLSSSLTTLIAAEMTGAAKGLGVLIQTASQFFKMDTVLMGIVVIGVLGLLLQKLVRVLEKKALSWQDVIEEE